MKPLVPILVAHLIVIILGFSGLIDKVMKWIPVPIVMGMIVGVMIRFATEMITSMTVSPLLAGFAIGSFYFITTFKKGTTCFNGINRSGSIGVLYKSISISRSAQVHLSCHKSCYRYFSFDAIVSIGIPLSAAHYLY